MVRQLCVMIFLLCEIFEIIHGDIIQRNPVVSVNEGDPVVLSCFFLTKQISMSLWYKQITGEEPRLIVSSILHLSKNLFHNGFDSNHFDAIRGSDSFNLTIVNAVQSDSGTYYCAFSFSNIIQFGNGTRLVTEGAEISKPTNLKLPKTELVKSDVNVPLRCSIQNEIVSGGSEHRLYWFKHGSEESPPGSVYVHGNTSDGCVRSSEADCLSPTCMYNLPKKTFNSSQIYCALATCGEILLGKISKHSPDNFQSQNMLIYIQIGLALLLAISFAVNILLCCLRKSERKSHQIQTTNEDDDDVSMNKYREMTYATVQISTKHSRVKKQRHPEDTLYSGLACQQQS
ncbi:hypothetical protein QQF64_030807 [Cirrhinus molitorella]|uniref:Ig-like domain-containing protein n=1 Tax=Cirrhinus molitorella TaxID=172907 RepID=A0ABR3N4Q7_9TELE